MKLSTVSCEGSASLLSQSGFSAAMNRGQSWLSGEWQGWMSDLQIRGCQVEQGVDAVSQHE